MATPRKHWFRVPDSVLHEGWDDSVLATLVRLQAYLNTRWAREARTPHEACEAVLAPAACMLVTGRQRLGSARSVLRQCAGAVTLTIDYRGADTFVRWPKWAEFQQIATRGLPESRPRAAPSHPIPSPSLPESSPTNSRSPENDIYTCGGGVGGSASPPPRTPAPEFRLTPDEKPNGHGNGKAKKPKPVKRPFEITDPEVTKLIAWGAREHGKSEPEIRHAIEVVRAWAATNEEQKINWYAAIQGAVLRGWGVEGCKSKPNMQAADEEPLHLKILREDRERREAAARRR